MSRCPLADRSPGEDAPGGFVFGGFSSPHYTQVPDDFFDVLLAELTPAEFKVAAYIVRRTFGWKKEADTISLSQMVNGIRRRDGSYVDRGTGLHKDTVIKAIKGLLLKGVIVRQRNASPERGFEATTYAIRMQGDPLSEEATSLVDDPDKGDQTPSSEKPTRDVDKSDQGDRPGWSARPTTLVGRLAKQEDSSQQPTVQEPAAQHRTFQETGARADLLTARQLWQLALDELRRATTPATFDTWLQNSVGLDQADGLFVVGVPSNFAREWLETRLRGPVEAALRKVTGRTTRLVVQRR
jgi:hypothetical protein